MPAVILTLFLSCCIAFVVARFSFKFNLALLGLFTAANLLPPQSLLIPVYNMLDVYKRQVVGVSSAADTTGYTGLQKKSAEFVASAKSIAQFMDRDTRPDFASTVMIPAIQDFLKTPTDISGLVTKIQQQKVSIFGS